ncbi:hypothetical protein IIU_05752 [Bacillus cereus VD133]|uniref:Uncharacterized protein n=1 Tax=Bacillus cereus VD133 TaxID=1053233 RepID=A0A9W5PLH9_BACCE|nr:hypothetical protein [Bacillus cereus]EOO28634.1 hypothetical protein IIU_05752 [Bacillus cereus VD133]
MNNQMIKTASAITEAESMKFAKGKPMSKSKFEKILNSSEVIKLKHMKDISSLARPIKQNNGKDDIND